MKCLEKDRTRRYETANGLASDLERHMNHEPVTAVAPSMPYLVSRFLRRHRAPVAVAAIVTLLLIAGVTVSTWQSVRAIKAERAQRQARQQAESAREAEARESYAAKLALATAKLEGGEASRAREILESCPPHLRHWEWGYLAQICDSGPRVLEGHLNEVQNLMFTRDGLRLVTYEGASGPLIWDVGTGRRVATAARV